MDYEYAALVQQVAGSSEHGSESFVSTKCGEFCNLLGNC